MSPFFVPMMMTNATAGTVAMQFGWTGPEPVHRDRVRGRARTRSARRARLIRDGSADVVMAGGTEACHDAAPRSRRSRA